MIRRFVTLILLFSFTALLGAESVDVKGIAEKLERIGRERLSPLPKYDIYDPFRRAEILVRRKAPPLRRPAAPRPRVTAVFNERAFVAGRWVKAGDRIGRYRVAAVRSDGVVLHRKGHTLFLPLIKPKKLLHIKDMP